MGRTRPPYPPEFRERMIELAQSVTGKVKKKELDLSWREQSVEERLKYALVHGVVDFIDVGFGGFRWPTFNIADMAVTCGAVALAVILWSEGRIPQGPETTEAPSPSAGPARAST